MAEVSAELQKTNRWHLTADWWAVIASLVVAGLVKFGALPRIPW
jgi:hypothetical protein